MPRHICWEAVNFNTSDRLAPAETDCVVFFWCLTAESPADCVGEAEESDVLLSHRRAALAGNTSQPLHRAAHRSAADRVRDIRPQLHHSVLQEQRQGAQGEDTHALNIRREAGNLDLYLQTDTECSKYILSSLHVTCFVTASSPLLCLILSHTTPSNSLSPLSPSLPRLLSMMSVYVCMCVSVCVWGIHPPSQEGVQIMIWERLSGTRDIFLLCVRG